MTTSRYRGMLDPADTSINRYIGSGLTLARIVRGLSVVALATTVGMEPRRLVRLERGEAECTARELYMLAEALNVPVDYFFEGVAPGTELRPAAGESPDTAKATTA